MTATVLVAAGGTGGHVFPGIATAQALMSAHPDVRVEFVGTADRLEASLVPEAGFTLHTVPAMALARKISPAALRLPGVIWTAVRRVRELIAERDVVAAIGFGGYTSVPLALAARTTSTPLVVHEQNAVPGIANRLAARAAVTVAVSFEQALDGFGRTPTVLTGNPVRSDLVTAEADADLAAARVALRDDALDAFGLAADRRTLFVFGGSQGAKQINDALIGATGRWDSPGDLQILHATGARTHDTAVAAWQDAGIDAVDGTATDGFLHVVCRAFIDRMDQAYAAADVVVCRAGASSIAELTALAVPAVLVPYPHATADHQTANAMAVQAHGGAVVLADVDTTPDSLIGAAQPLLVDDTRRTAMALASKAFGRPDAAAAVASILARAGHLEGPA